MQCHLDALLQEDAETGRTDLSDNNQKRQHMQALGNMTLGRASQDNIYATNSQREYKNQNFNDDDLNTSLISDDG